MDSVVNLDSLLFNTTFLRAMLIPPILLTCYVILVVYKQYKEKFKGKPLMSLEKASKN